jgi:hypothetical protein
MPAAILAALRRYRQVARLLEHVWFLRIPCSFGPRKRIRMRVCFVHNARDANSQGTKKKTTTRQKHYNELVDAYLLAIEMLECCVRENSRHEEEQSLGFRGREQTKKKKKLLSPRVNRAHSKEIKQRKVIYI